MGLTMTSLLYLDHQATTPVDKRVIDAMSPYWANNFGNPHSNTHAVGWNADKAIAKSKGQIAEAIGSESNEIIFTSGATESNNLAVYALCQLSKKYPDRKQVLVSPIEHKCVLNAASFWAEQFDLDLVTIKIDETGKIDLEWLRDAVNVPTLFCSIGYVNNEIGTIQPLHEISDILHSKDILLHSDCAQAPRTIACDDISEAVDIASFSGHKLGGPPGIGVMFVAAHLHEEIVSLLHGGGQQMGLRPGTLPLPLCVGLGAAFDILNSSETRENFHTVSKLRNYFFDKLTVIDRHITLNGPPLAHRHVGNLNVAFNGIKAFDLLMSMQPHLAASTGSACSSGEIEPSHVILGLGHSRKRAENSVRFSLSHVNTKDEIDEALNIIAKKTEFLSRLGISN